MPNLQIKLNQNKATVLVLGEEDYRGATRGGARGGLEAPPPTPTRTPHLPAHVPSADVEVHPQAPIALPCTTQSHAGAFGWG